MLAPQIILELIERFDRNIEAYESGKYNETQVRREFIDPFFEALGWDVENKAGNAETYKDVIHEDAVKVSGVTKAPDYSFRIGGQRKFFVEAKKPSVNLKDEPAAAFQIRRYAWSAKLPLSIITDFEEFAVYDCRIKPDQKDKADKARIKYYTYKQYVEKWDEIAAVFSKDAILKGSFDKFAESSRAKRGTSEVDGAFLTEIESWRDALARNIALRNRLSRRELNDAVQRTIDRIIFLRIAEDRGIEDYGVLRSLCNGNNTYGRLQELFYKADDRYNSGLFHFRHEKDEAEPPDNLTTRLVIDDKILKDILKRLYYPDSPYEFSVLPADILGQVYEQFLGKVIRLTSDHRAVVEDKPEVKKAGGVFYTPTYIVDYIVKNTVGKLLDGKNPKTAEKLHILDPACGSGSFLLGAYQNLLDWHLKWYIENDPEKYAKAKKPILYQGAGGAWHLTTAQRKRILLNNIYGVDIDIQAVEVTKLSLLLKVLEDETGETLNYQFKLFHERALPDLGGNIKCGNSLIGPDFYDGKQTSFLDTEEMQHVNVFDWQKEFPEIFKVGGFDAVIGNPPWGASLAEKEKIFYSKKYSSFMGNHDSYLFFIEKAIALLKDKGFSSFVTPDSWIKIPQAKELRKLTLEKMSLVLITILPQKVFDKVSANCLIYIAIKKSGTDITSINVMFPKSILSNIAKNEFDDSYKINTSFWKTSEDFQFQIYQKDEIANLIRRIKTNCSDAVNYLDVMQGIVPYSIENHSRETIEKRAFHSDKSLSNEYGIWVQGRSITRYNLDTKGSEFLRYGQWLHRPRRPKYFVGERILIQEITGGHPPRISACFCDEILYHDPGIISCLNIGNLSTKFLLGIINSNFLSWFHRYSSPKGIRHTFPKVLIGDIRNFPIPKIEMSKTLDKIQHDNMVQLVEQMLSLNKQLDEAKTAHEQTLLKRQIDTTDKQIDKLVYELYELTPKEIKIVEGNENGVN
ncbi:MAG TPA: N-6 DNA methylase [Smithella sp.]|nr:N-6 DNA methylase [Smithella sp.]